MLTIIYSHLVFKLVVHSIVEELDPASEIHLLAYQLDMWWPPSMFLVRTLASLAIPLTPASCVCSWALRVYGY